MQTTYLCAKHAEWVYTNPNEAAYFLSRDEKQGASLFNTGRYSDSIPYLGCAFDIAEILLELDDNARPWLIKKLQTLSYMLVCAYQMAEHAELKQAIALRTINIVSTYLTAAHHEQSSLY